MVWSKPLVAVALAASLLVAACGGAADAPVDGGSAQPELPEPATGPVPDLRVAPGSIASPLPDIAVRRLNGDGGWVQFRNELPAEQPVLIWFWAPF